MNNTPKVSLTIILEGSTLVRKREPEVVKYILKRKDVINKRFVKDANKVVKVKTFNHYPLEAKPASMHINIGVDSYNYMISRECPSWIRIKMWNAMSPIQRLEAHLNRICEHFMGKSFTYMVLDD